MQANRVSRLFATRWPDKCERPCASKAHCSCFTWAQERGQDHAPSLYVNCELIGVALVTLGIPFACVAIAAICAVCF